MNCSISINGSEPIECEKIDIEYKEDVMGLQREMTKYECQGIEHIDRRIHWETEISCKPIFEIPANFLLSTGLVTLQIRLERKIFGIVFEKILFKI